MSVKNFLTAMERMAKGEFFRKSTPDDHATKFELWDTVYILHDNSIIDARICEINIKIIPMPTTSKLTQVTYKLTRLECKEINGNNYTNAFAEVKQDDCFATREELINAL